MARILIADDDPKFVHALRIRLEGAGHEVLEATDSYCAVAVSGREHPDLLLLDINMPAGDGFSVQDRVRKIDDALAHVPVIYMTGSADDALEDEAFRHGAAALVHKPFNMTDLLMYIDTALAAA